MPRRLLVIGWIFCALGAASLVGVLIGAARGNGLTLDTNVLLLPVGIGLLTASRPARACAAFLAGLTVALSLAAAAFALFAEPGGVSLSVLEAALAGATAQAVVPLVSIAAAAACVLTIRMLYAPPVSDVFRQPMRRSGGSAGSEPRPPLTHQPLGKTSLAKGDPSP